MKAHPIDLSWIYPPEKNKRDQSLEPDGNSARQNAGIRNWNDFWASCKKYILGDMDGKPKTKNQSTREVELGENTHSNDFSLLYPSKMNKNPIQGSTMLLRAQ